MVDRGLFLPAFLVLATISLMKDLAKRLTIAQSKLEMPCSSDTSPIRVWTIQPVGVLVQLREDRVLHTDPGRIPKEFHHAYDWMRAQMGQRLAYYDGHYPWWGWHTPRPDLRQSAHLPHATQGVRLQLQIDPTEVLLSDFDAWHSVLNRGYLALNVQEDEAWYQRFEAAILNQWPWPPPEPWYSGILTSWERVFDLEALATSEYWQSGPRYIQATFETLRLANVRQATRFVAR